MVSKIIPEKEFRKEFKRLSKKYKSLKSDMKNLQAELINNPCLGTHLGNGIYKVRMAVASKGKGKSGGVRVITYNSEEIDDDVVIHLLTIYDKSEYDSLSDSFIRSLVVDATEEFKRLIN